MINKTMMTDFYELTMANTYYNEGKKDEIVYFDVFFRKNPFDGGYTISGGLDETINYIKNFKYDEESINYLRSLGNFTEEFLKYLSTLKFKGDIYAVPDGTFVFPNEPVLTVRADIITAQLIETALLANFNHASLVTTKSKRITKEASVPVMEFGLRRARGLDSGLEASKCSYIGGCIGTSNTYAGYKYGIPVMGTMAHSLVMESNDEFASFLSYAKSNPSNCVLLVDTYDTLRSGIPNAIRVYKEFLKPNGYKLKGIRIDSGDLAYLSKMARKMLDESGLYDTTICLSNGLDEYTIRDLINQKAVFDSLGVGDNISASKERLGGVYKLVAVEHNNKITPRIKVSNDSIKTINPGFKKVYRLYDKDTGYALGDVVSLYDEVIDKNHYTLVHPIDTWKKQYLTNYNVRSLLVPIFKDGNLVYNDKTLKEKSEVCEEEFNTFYPEITRIDNPHEYYVDLSDKLRMLKNEMIKEHKEKTLIKK